MTRATPLHRLVLLVWLTAVWVTLWGSVTVANVGGGLLVALAILVVFPPVPVRPDAPGDGDTSGDHAVLPVPARLRVSPLYLVSLAGWFVGALVASTWKVAAAVVTPPGRSRIDTEIVDVTLRSSSPVVTTLVSNAITLTPGTLTLEARGSPAMLSVHAMFADDVESVRAEVWEIERRVVAAVGTATDRDALTARAGRERGGEG